MKRKSAWLLLLCAVCLILVACGPSEQDATTTAPTTTTTPKEVSVSLDTTLAELDVWDTLQLQATTQNTEENVSWHSSDDSVATVSDSGLVTAVSEGSATITARVAGKEATCSVTVTNSHTAPVLKPERTEVALDKDATYDLTVQTLWKGEPLTGVQYTWTLCEDAAADVAELTQHEDGSVTIKALAYGETAYTVSADVRGTLLSKKITIKVLNTNISFLAENLTEEGGVYKAKVALINTENDSTTFVPQVKVLDGGQEVSDATLVWTSRDASVVSVEGGVFTAQSEGTTVLTTSYMNNEFSVTVQVYRPEITLDEEILIETADYHDILLTTALEGNVTGVLLGDVDVFAGVNAETGAIVLAQDLLPVSTSEMGRVSVRIETDKASYLVSGAVYTKVIRTAEDLDNFGAIAKSVESKPNLWGGYFILGNDIDYNKAYTPFINYWVMEGNGVIWEGTAWNDCRDNGFRGVFDGNGYTIKGLATTGAAGGFIGLLHTDGVICNVSFINATHIGWGGYVCSAGNGTIRNVYIQCDAMGGGSVPDKSGFFFSGDCMASARLINCLVEVSGFPTGDANTYGIGSFHLGYGILNGAYAIGVPSDRAIRVISDTGAGGDVYGAYADYEAFSAAGIDFSDWEGDFWTLISGLPYPKHLADSGDGVTNVRVTKRTDVELNNAEIPTTAIDLTSYGVSGTLESILLNGQALANASFADGILTLTASDFGVNWGEQTLEVVISNGPRSYKVTIPVLLITKVIRTADDLATYYSLAKACCPEDYLWAGYFVLGNDIACDGRVFGSVTDWWTFENAGQGGNFTNGRIVGFKGVFDGRGHCIDNATFNFRVSGLVGTTLHQEGIVRNLSLTNIVHGGGSGLICYAGCGRIENVYITIKGITNIEGNDRSAAFISNDCMGETRVVNCVAVYLDGSLPEDITNTFALGSFHLGYGILNNVYAIGMPADKAINTLSDCGAGGDIYGSFETAEAFAAAVEVTKDNGWDTDYWTVDSNGIAIPKALLAE